MLPQPKTLLLHQPRPEQFQVSAGGDAERDRRPIHIGQAVRIDQPTFGVNVLAEMILTPEGRHKGVRQVVRMVGPGGLARLVASRMEQSRQLAEGVNDVALSHAVPVVARRQFHVEPRAADQPVGAFPTQQVFRGCLDRRNPLSQPRHETSAASKISAAVRM